MNKKVYLQVPTPCHENWNVMTPVEQGRFCKSCERQVVDFSDMTYKEVLNILSKTTGSTCGRFTNDQLNKPLIIETPSSIKPYKFFLSAFIPAFLFVGKAQSQQKLQGKVVAHEKPAPPIQRTLGFVMMDVAKVITGSVTLPTGEAASMAILKLKGTNVSTKADKYGRFTIVFPADKEKVILQVIKPGYNTKELQIEKDKLKPLHVKLEALKEFTKGEVGVRVEHDEGTAIVGKMMIATELRGKVLDEDNKPLPGATVQVIGSNNTVVSDSTGSFKVNVPTSTPVDLKVSYIGYETIIKPVLPDTKEEIILTKMKAQWMGEVVVTASPTTVCNAVLGGVSIVKRVTPIDTAKSFVAKVFRNEMFKVYPNPVSKTSIIHITFKEAGNYTMQLSDNGGKLYLAKDVKVGAKQVANLDLPANISSGIYYIKAINSITRKQYVDKIIIQ